MRFEFEDLEDFIAEVKTYDPMEIGIKVHYTTAEVPKMAPDAPDMIRVASYLTFTAADGQKDRCAIIQKPVSTQMVQVGQQPTALAAATEKQKNELIATLKKAMGEPTIFLGQVGL